MAEVKALLKEARKLIDDKKNKEAQECCKDILRRDKQNYMALVILGKALEDSDQAPLAYQKAIATKPTQLLAWHGLASYYERKEDTISKTKLLPIYDEILKLQIEDEKAIEIVTKVGQLGCSLKNSEAISIVIRYMNVIQEKVREVAEKQFLELIKSDVPCKHEDVSAVLTILYDIKNRNPNDFPLIVIPKVIIQQHDFSSSVEQIVALDFFTNNETIKKWLCEKLCEMFIENQSFKFDIDKYIDIITKDVENTRCAGLLMSMVHYNKGLYLEAYKQCVPLINYYEAHKVEVIFIINCTIMLKKWSVTQKLATNFLIKAKNSDLILTLRKFLFLSLVEQQKWVQAIDVAKEISKENLSANELAFLAKCYIEINESAEHVLKDLDTTGHASQLRAHALLKQEKYQEAISVIQKSDENTLNYFILGKAYWNLKEYDQCLVNLLKSAKLNSDHAETFYFLGMLYDDFKKDLEKAKKCYEKALSLYNTDSHCIRKLSEVYTKLGLKTSDFELLKKASDTLKIKETWVNLRLGLHFLDQKEWEYAIIHFRNIVKESQNDLIALECLADAYYARGSFTSALRAYNKVMTLNPNTVHSCHCLTKIGCIHALLTEYNEAISTFKKVFQIDPHCLLALKGVAEALMRVAKKKAASKLYGSARDLAQDAINYITKALSKGKKFICFWNLLADALMFITRLPNKYSYVFIKDAFNDSNESVKKDKVDIYPQMIACYSYVAKYRQQFASYNLASAYFEFYSATNNLAHCHTSFNLIVACIKDRPSAWRNWNLLGKICVFLKRYDIAQHCFIKALTATRKWSVAKVWCNLGTLYLKVNLHKLANYCFWRGQSNMPSHPHSWIGQGLIAEVLREEEAMDLFRHATRLGYHKISALGYSDWVCRTLRNLNWRNDPECKFIIEGLYAITYATDLMDWFLTFEPNDACALNIIGILQERSGLLRSALESYKRANMNAEDDKKNIVLLNIARVHLRLENYEEATRAYQAVGEASLDSTCGLALSLYKMGQFEESYTAYNTALQWLCNDDDEKAELLVAMAGIIYKFKGKDDAKTLLFHSLQAAPKKPTPYSLFALCSLGILHSDQSLTKSAIGELKKFEKNSDFGYDIGFLKSYAISNEDIEGSIKLLTDAIHDHPGTAMLWFCMAHYCMRASQSRTKVASFFAQRAINLLTYDEQKTCNNIGKMFATASIAEYNAGNRNKAFELAKSGLHMYPRESDIWAAVLLLLLTNKNWLNRKEWLLGALARMRKDFEIPRPLSRWIILTEKRLQK